MFSARIAGYPRIAAEPDAFQDCAGLTPIPSSTTVSWEPFARTCDLRARRFAWHFCSSALAVPQFRCGSTTAASLQPTVPCRIRRRHRAPCVQTQRRQSSGSPTGTGGTVCARRTFGSKCDRLNRAQTLARAAPPARRGPKRLAERRDGRGTSAAATAAAIERSACACATAIFGPWALRPRAPPLRRIGASASKVAVRRQGYTSRKIRKPRSKT